MVGGAFGGAFVGGAVVGTGPGGALVGAPISVTTGLEMKSSFCKPGKPEACNDIVMTPKPTVSSNSEPAFLLLAATRVWTLTDV